MLASILAPGPASGPASSPAGRRFGRQFPAAKTKLAKPEAPRVAKISLPALLLLAGQLLRGDGAGGAILVRVLHLGPDGARLVLFAGCRVQVGQVKLRHAS